MPCYTIKSGDTVARVHADEPPSERSQEAIRDVIAAAGRMMRGECESCREPTASKGPDGAPLCEQCTAEIEAYENH